MSDEKNNHALTTAFRSKTGFKFEKLWDAGEAGLVEFTAS
jgi:hypothetical protein